MLSRLFRKAAKNLIPVWSTLNCSVSRRDYSKFAPVGLRSTMKTQKKKAQNNQTQRYNNNLTVKHCWLRSLSDIDFEHKSPVVDKQRYKQIDVQHVKCEYELKSCDLSNGIISNDLE